MNTSVLLFDILIIGFQCMIWIAGIIFSFFVPLKTFKNFLHNYDGSVILLAIPIAYSFGIIFDHIIKWAFSIFRSKDEEKLYENISIIKITAFDSSVQTFLDNAYARLRIARSTAFNVPFIIIAACFFVSKNDLELLTSKCATIVWILIIGIIFLGFSFFSWNRRNKEYLQHIKSTKELAWYKEFIKNKKE